MGEIKKLRPLWRVGQRLKYIIKKEETFNYKDRQSDPFIREYAMELTVLENGIIEIFYPNSILSSTKYFNEFRQYFKQLSQSQNNCLYISHDKNFEEIKIQNFEALKKNLRLLKEKFQTLAKDQEQFEEFEWSIDNLIENNEKMEKYFLEDIFTIFDYYGIDLDDDVYVDLNAQKAKKRSLLRRILKFLNFDIGEINLIMFDFLKNGQYKIESLTGNDTISTKTRENWEEIKTEFLNDEFDFDFYNDSTLHHKKYLYQNQSFFLEHYKYDMKIATPTMLKRKKISIQLKS